MKNMVDVPRVDEKLCQVSELEKFGVVWVETRFSVREVERLIRGSISLTKGSAAE